MIDWQAKEGEWELLENHGGENTFSWALKCFTCSRLRRARFPSCIFHQSPPFVLLQSSEFRPIWNVSAAIWPLYLLLRGESTHSLLCFIWIVQTAKYHFFVILHLLQRCQVIFTTPLSPVASYLECICPHFAMPVVGCTAPCAFVSQRSRFCKRLSTTCLEWL